MYFDDRQREVMRLAAGNERQAAEAKLEAKSAGGKEWEFFIFLSLSYIADENLPHRNSA